ncbi:hypothetical protein PRIPAC_94731 [Pristionchus pacificus]|uniref:Uncharacterized protein n=1 Tax=Pristionchus pacificus TaxID=54126 RepID=A0A2A6BBP2_PRIPA|nr:hypothetical protein PRIPAC_94731 [Pristionchus pacificus]|eukprot:PDM63312.1 hypothetical protein PRIPAC_50527 [Pristionchus pacificus]
MLTPGAWPREERRVQLIPCQDQQSGCGCGSTCPSDLNFARDPIDPQTWIVTNLIAQSSAVDARIALEFLTICQKFNTRDSINGLSLMTRDNVTSVSCETPAQHAAINRHQHGCSTRSSAAAAAAAATIPAPIRCNIQPLKLETKQEREARFQTSISDTVADEDEGDSKEIKKEIKEEEDDAENLTCGLACGLCCCWTGRGRCC